MRRSDDVDTTRPLPIPPDLAALAAAASSLRGVRRGDLAPGDTVIVATRNSLYALAATSNGEFAVSGGWFNEHPAGGDVAVNGCTWGGRALLTDMIAAPGLFLEFGNGVRTTRIQAVRQVSGRQNAQSN
jgi:hypothetical protein